MNQQFNFFIRLSFEFLEFNKIDEWYSSSDYSSSDYNQCMKIINGLVFVNDTCKRPLCTVEQFCNNFTKTNDYIFDEFLCLNRLIFNEFHRISDNKDIHISVYTNLMV